MSYKCYIINLKGRAIFKPCVITTKNLENKLRSCLRMYNIIQYINSLCLKELCKKIDRL